MAISTNNIVLEIDGKFFQMEGSVFYPLTEQL